MKQTFLNKKNLLKLIIILSFIGLTALSFIFVDYYAKNNNPNEDIINKEEIIEANNDHDSLVSVYLELIDKDGNIIFDEVRKTKDKEVLYDVLVKYHEVRAESSTYGMIIFDIDSVKTKFYQENYISILVNGKYSSFGISSIYVYDGIRVTFKEVAL